MYTFVTENVMQRVTCDGEGVVKGDLSSRDIVPRSSFPNKILYLRCSCTENYFFYFFAKKKTRN